MLWQRATIVGAGDIAGTPGNDVIVGSAADDIIDGTGGDDRICGLLEATNSSAGWATTKSTAAPTMTLSSATYSQRAGMLLEAATIGFSVATARTT